MKKPTPLSPLITPIEAMLVFTAFCPAPDDILIIGPGSGSLLQSCAQQFPHARISIVDNDEQSLVWWRLFSSKVGNNRVQVIHADPARYVTHHRRCADVILFSADNKRGPIAQLNSQFFYDGCHQALRDTGVVVTTFMSTTRSGSCLAKMRTTFDGQVYRTATQDNDRVIVPALKNTALPDWSATLAQPGLASSQAGLDLSPYLAQMRDNDQSRRRSEVEP